VSQYQGINPDIWEMLTDVQRVQARRSVVENWAAQFKPRPCKCEGRADCPCPCHRGNDRSL
jgi:hypothetical protein